MCRAAHHWLWGWFRHVKTPLSFLTHRTTLTCRWWVFVLFPIENVQSSATRAVNSVGGDACNALTCNALQISAIRPRFSYKYIFATGNVLTLQLQGKESYLRYSFLGFFFHSNASVEYIAARPCWGHSRVIATVLLLKIICFIRCVKLEHLSISRFSLVIARISSVFLNRKQRLHFFTTLVYSIIIQYLRVFKTMGIPPTHFSPSREREGERRFGRRFEVRWFEEWSDVCVGSGGTRLPEVSKLSNATEVQFCARMEVRSG